MANGYHGACIDTFCGTRELFKSRYGFDNDPISRQIYTDLTGVNGTATWEDTKTNFPRFGNIIPSLFVVLLVLTPPCPDFSTGSPNPEGTRGSKGGKELTRIPEIISEVKPLVVFIEQVANLVNFLEDLEHLLLGITCQQYVVHAAIVSMAGYGDMENCWRLVIVAIHESLGEFAQDFRIPTGEFSDDVAYSSSSAATPTEDIPERFHRFMHDYELKPMHEKPSKIRKTAQTAPGFGFSSHPNACYDMRGIAPKSTTHGAGRHLPLGWTKGDSIAKTYMYTPSDVARHKNLSVTLLEVYEKAILKTEGYGPKGLSATDLDKGLYKCLGNGFSCKFGCTIYRAIHRLLETAGVPHDIVRTTTTAEEGVQHWQADMTVWRAEITRRSGVLKAVFANWTDSFSRSGGQSKADLYTISLDTGANMTLIWDDQDPFLINKTKSNSVVQVAKAGSQFATTSTGALNMACVNDQMLKVAKAMNKSKKKLMIEEVQWIAPTVVTVPKTVLRKQLAGFPQMFAEMKVNLDLRQPSEGTSCIWKRHPSYPHDLSKRLEIPLRFDAVDLEWTFQYIPAGKEMNKAREALIKHTHKDLVIIRGVENATMELNLDHEACMIDLLHNGEVKQLKGVNISEEVEKLVKEKLPADKRIEVSFGRHPYEKNLRGVKQGLLDKRKRMMPEQEAHEHFGHMGTGANCQICAMIRGAMKYMYRVVDKYIETRMGYFFDMDTLTVNVRDLNGTKYYTILRDRGSAFIKEFPLQLKSDFPELFDEWITYMRRDRIYDVYNWDFCSVIKADNDGVWMRKSAKWLALINKHNIRMYYTDKDRKETNCHAERTIGLVESVAKACILQKGLPPNDHYYSFIAAVWLLCRFPSKASLARDPPDGDMARPIEQLTYGQYSRARINRELSNFCLPGSLVFVHNAKAKGSSLTEHKMNIAVAREMNGAQLIVHSPFTKMESKTDSYILANPGREIHWRDQLGIPYVKSYRSLSAPGDEIENMNARRLGKMCEMMLPEEAAKQFSKLKQMKKIDFIKHVKTDGVIHITAPDLAKLEEQMKKITEEHEERSMSQKPDNPIELLTTQELENPAEVAHEVVEQVTTYQGASANPSEADAIESTNYEVPGRGQSLFHREVVRNTMTDEERAAVMKSRSGKQAKSSQAKRNSDGSIIQHPWKHLMATDHPIEYLQQNPKKAASAERYEIYKHATTLKDAKLRGASSGDILWDMKHGYWWPKELPKSLPEPDDSERGGQQEVLLERTAQESAATAVAAPHEAVQAVEQIQKKAHEIKAQAADLQSNLDEIVREREWKQALSKGNAAAVKSRKSFYALATDKGVPAHLFGTYHEWLILISKGVLNEDNIGTLKPQIGSTKRVSKRTLIGTLVPKPKGSIWNKMLFQKYSPEAEAEPDDNMKEASKIGSEIFRAFNAFVRINDKHIVELNAHAATKVRAKDHRDGIIPPPKGITGLYSISETERREKFIAALVKEFSDLEKMETISHLHTKQELLDKYGVDIDKTPPVATMCVFDNKFTDGKTAIEDLKAKARVCVEGTPRQMQKGVHYDSVYAPTPNQESIMYMNALVVHCKLFRRAFDVGNAYGWGKQAVKLALEYPRGLQQYNQQGEKLYMCLLKNTYGKPDGANLWYKERDTFWLTFFNDEDQMPGWTCRQFVMEQSLFEFTWSKDDEETQFVYLLAWSDDCDMSGTSEEMMQIIEEKCHNKWKVKNCSPDFMLGVRRNLTIDEDDVWSIHLTQAEFIDGLVGAWKTHMAIAGWEVKSPKTPVPPGLFLTADQKDPKGFVPEDEYKAVDKRGYKAVCGSLLWVSRFCHPEISAGVSMCCRVMQKPSELAWNATMQIIAWLRDHKEIGIKFKSDETEHGLVSTTDASFKGDPKDAKCMACQTIHWMGGPISFSCGKLPRVAAASGGSEHMSMRIAASTIMKFRHLFREIGLTDPIVLPTIMYCDSKVAINWQKTGKITAGNHHQNVDWHMTREWEREGHLQIKGLDTKDIYSDLGTKCCGEAEYDSLYLPLVGHESWVIKFPRETMTFT
jgi:site-specific DNA-cytosine methylase